MIRAAAVVPNALGLHARPAAVLARTANRFSSRIRIKKGKREADAKSVASLLMLVATAGSELEVTARGEDEKQAMTAVLETIAAGFTAPATATKAAKQKAADEEAAETNAPPMHKLTGSGGGGGGGVIIGRAAIHAGWDATPTPQFQIDKNQIANECRRYEKAVARVRADFRTLHDKSQAQGGEATAVMDIYLALLDDPAFTAKPAAIIRRRHINAEWAVKEQAAAIADGFRQIEDDYLKERASDLSYVTRRLLAALQTHTPKKQKQQKAVRAGRGRVLVAADLEPADVIILREQGYLGFVTEAGSGTSHTMILARSMKLPAVVGVRGVLAHAQNQSPLLVDAAAGAVFVHPTREVVVDYRRQRIRAQQKSKPAATTAPTATGRGVRDRRGALVNLHANIDLPDDCKAAQQAGADGIGLFRTEFLFLHRNQLPSEDEQFEHYRHVLKTMYPLPVVIRTLDIGGDKLLASNSRSEPNRREETKTHSALGVRAIRYCLQHQDIFMTQLRALLRAHAQYGNLKILIPMLSHPREGQQTRTLLHHAREQLRVSHHIDNEPPPLGGMIEVPAAAFIIRALAKTLAFFSIGTNDLVQYTLATDRNDEALAALYTPLHPAVLALITQVVARTHSNNRPLMICGEMAGNSEMTRLILGMGIRQLSMRADRISAVRECVEASDCEDLHHQVARLLRQPDPARLAQQLAHLNAREA